MRPHRGFGAVEWPHAAREALAQDFFCVLRCRTRAERHVREHFGADPAALILVAADEKEEPALAAVMAPTSALPATTSATASKAVSKTRMAGALVSAPAWRTTFATAT